MATPVKMPELGESITEGTITRWLKQEGDQVEADEPLLEISTDKVDTEVPSPVAGVLKTIKVQADETVEVGAELAIIEQDGEAGGDAEGDEGGQAEESAEADSDTAEEAAEAEEGSEEAGSEKERESDHMTLQEIEEAILSEQSELIEDYPSDPRGHSCLVLGFTRAGLPIHMVCGNLYEQEFLVVTIYRPDPAQWVEWRARKEPG